MGASRRDAGASIGHPLVGPLISGQSTIIREMGRPDPINKAIPRWLTVLVAALPAGGTGVALLLAGILGVQIRVFNLSPRDSGLVAGIGLILVFTVLALLILCIALMRAVGRAASGK